MDELEARILKEGKVLPGNIIKVGSFLNHKVDTVLMSQLAQEFKKYFDISKVSLLLTAEASGIAIASICSYIYGIPMIFAKKAKSDNIEGGLICSEIHSYTYNKNVTLIVESGLIKPTDNVLIIDDFLAKGEALRGLIDIVHQTGAHLEGIGVVVEKGFQGGGDKIRKDGYKLKSLAIIDSIDDGVIKLRKQA